MAKMKREYKIRLYLACCLFLGFLLSACSTPQVKPYEIKKTNEANWERYQPTDLQLVIDEQSKGIDFSPEIKMTINAIAANQPYRVKVTYSDNYRKITDEKRQLISFWCNSVQIDKKMIDVFGHEMLFKHGSTLFWFPIQSQLLPDFKKELKKGDEVNLYAMFVGTVWEQNQLQWVFIVNEFQKARE